MRPGLAAAEMNALASSSLTDLDSCSDPQRVAQMLAPPPDAATRRRLEEARGQLYVVRALQLAGDFDQAQATLDAAQLEVDALDRDDARAHADFVRGALLAALDERDAGTVALENAAWTAMKIGDNDLALDAASELIMVLGRDQLDVRRGKQWIERAEELSAPLVSDSNAVIRVRVNAADFLNRIGDYDGAKRNYEEAQAQLQARGRPGADPLMGETLYGVARLAYFRNDFEEAYALFKRAQAINVEAYGPEHAKVGWTYSALGTLERRLGRLEESIASHEKAVGLLRRAKGADGSRVAGALTNLSSAYADVGRHDDAERVLLEAIGMLEERQDHATLLHAFGSLGDLRVAQERLPDAVAAYARAVEEGQRDLPDDHAEIAHVRALKGRAHLALDQPELAILELERAAAILETTSRPNYRADVEKDLAEARRRAASED